ncbi:dihydrodipicolinate synthase family protein [Citreicella sp. C3M06]|uniref:dihydrodipicolinate synthase family protein n=1 Tax=Citreicella sp. C3M06 TaxID=2841564 RepID=UPI001C0856E2|nr:dihydrodipicolinate synthase family protein [Citreicella sp. C3M06]MBU2963572.1 dihydrodipicolinate synthase family protein [Citreicella sp. C3M06]
MSMPSGLSAFPITPADADGRVDLAALGRIIDRLVAAQVGSIGVLGSTGIYMYLSRDERRRAVEAAQDRCGAIPLVVGIGALRTDEAIGLAQDARAMGAAAGLLSAVSYAPLSQDEVYEHFSAVAKASGLPICIYDNPGTTHFSFSPDLVARLSRVPGVVGIKNPPPPDGQMAHHLARQRSATSPGFSIGYSGDWCCPEAMIAGADTWYSVLGGIFPRICVALSRAAQAGDTVQARRLDAALAPVWEVFRSHSSLRAVYEIARQIGLTTAEPPRPILPLGAEGRRDIAQMLRSLPPEICG